MVPHPKTPILYYFYHLLWFYFLTVSEYSCLAKSYLVTTKYVTAPCVLHIISTATHA